MVTIAGTHKLHHFPQHSLFKAHGEAFVSHGISSLYLSVLVYVLPSEALLLADKCPILGLEISPATSFRYQSI